MIDASKPRRGFTLIELLTVVGVIAVLVALFIPAVQAAREAARRGHCANNLKQLGLALHAYHDAFNSLPPGKAPAAQGGEMFSCWIMVLPYLEQATVFNAVNFSQPIVSDANSTVRSTAIATLACPSDPDAVVREANASFIPSGSPLPRWFFTSYVGCVGSTDNSPTVYPDQRGFAQSDGVLSEVTPFSFNQITDGMGNTIFVSERSNFYLMQLSTFNPHLAEFYGWYFAGSPGFTLFTTLYPPNMPLKVAAGAGQNHAVAASSTHPGGVNTLMGDGSVRFIKDSVATWPFDPLTGYPSGASIGPGGFWIDLPHPRVWQALSTRSGGEVVSADSY